MELLSPTSRWYPFVSVDTDRLGGRPVFRGTRVPVQALFDYLSEGHDIAEFLDDFEGVPKDFAVGVLELASGNLAADLKRDTAA
jgi:uncharacterized protein (DUF433 family)